MADDKQTPDALFRQTGMIEQRAKQAKLLGLAADVLGANAFLGKPAIKGRVLCRGDAGGIISGTPIDTPGGITARVTARISSGPKRPTVSVVIW